MTHLTRIAAYLWTFHAEESGAATIEWVVGVAAAVSLTKAVTSSVNEGVMALACVDGSVYARVDLSAGDRCGVRSCVRPLCAVRLTAGPDEVRMPGPNQTIEL